MKHTLKTALTALTGLAVGLGLAGCAPDAPAPREAPVAVSPSPSPGPVPEAELVAEPRLTATQEQAVIEAVDYLNLAAFSRAALIDQLEYEGYSLPDARWAVAQLDVDWTQQAARKAEQILGFTAYSRRGLMDQLVYGGFTPEQAAHAADAVGL